MLLGNGFNNNNQSGLSKPVGNHQFENKQFVNKNYEFQQNISRNRTQKNIFTKDIKTQQHINPLNKNDMADKTLALLHERLNQGSISLDEFNKQCEILRTNRQK